MSTLATGKERTVRSGFASRAITGGFNRESRVRRRRTARTYKPGSVSLPRNADVVRMVTIYLASRFVSGPAVGGTALPPWSSSQPGDGPGAHCPPIRPCSRWGLTAAASPQTAGRSYRPISPLPRLTSRRYVSVPLSVPRSGGLPSRKPGRYPAPCPEEPGLSSPAPVSAAAATQSVRPSGWHSSTGPKNGSTTIA